MIKETGETGGFDSSESFSIIINPETTNLKTAALISVAVLRFLGKLVSNLVIAYN